MNILAIDFGTKNIGLAWCNTNIGVVLPFGKIKNQISKIKNSELVDIIKKEKIDQVVIGLPLGVGGSGKNNIDRVKRFAEELKKEISVSIDFFDERFTSQEADRMGGEASRDEKSAMVILDDYIKNKTSKIKDF